MHGFHVRAQFLPRRCLAFLNTLLMGGHYLLFHIIPAPPVSGAFGGLRRDIRTRRLVLHRVFFI
jgi:hypothetical protein